MTFKHGKFTDSPVMRQLERIAIRKGIAKPEEIVKKASVNLEPSNDLFSDIFKLAQSLRDRGFEKQANELEDNIINYKMAETHLYRAIDEDGEDLLGFAHPKGSVKVQDAKDKQGDVEDLLDQHKKIVDIVNKKPTGKYASIVESVATDLGIKKKADLNEDSSRNVAFYKNEILKELARNNTYFFYDGDSLYLSDDGDRKYYVLVDGKNVTASDKFTETFLQWYKRSNKITSEIWNEYLSGNVDPATIFSQYNLKFINSTLNARYNAVLNKIKSLPNLPIEVTEKNSLEALDVAKKIKDGINGLFDEFSWFDFKGLTLNDGERENKVRVKLIPALLQNVNKYSESIEKSFNQKTPEKSDDALLTAWWANNVAGKFDRLKDDALNANQDKLADEFMAIANIVRSGANKPFSETHNALVRLSGDNAEFNNINKLDSAAMEWENYFKNLKKASSENDLVKEALGHPPGATPASSSPVTRNSPAHKAVSAKQPGKEYDAVLAMQNTLNILAKALLLPELKDKFKNLINDNDAVKLSSILSGTGKKKGIHTDAPDGEWGPNTEKALQAAQALQDRIAKSNPQLASKTSLVTESQFNKGFKEEDIIAKANANRALLNNILTSVGAVHLIPGNPNEFDRLPMGDYTKNIDTENEGTIPLVADNVSSLKNLYDFLKNNRLITIDGIDQPEGLTLDAWDNVLRSLHARALNKLKKNKDDKMAQAYQNAIRQLYAAFKPVSDKAKTEGSADGIVNPWAKNEVFSPKDFEQGNKVRYEEHKPNATGKGDTKTVSAPGQNQEAGEGVGAKFINEKEKNLIQPFDYNINLRLLANNYPDKMQYYTAYAPLLSGKLINIQEFRQDPAVLADNLLHDPSVSDLTRIWPNIDKKLLAELNADPTGPKAMQYLKDAKLRMLSKIIMALRSDLSAVRDAWEERVFNEEMDEKLAQANNSFWNSWSKALSQLLNRITQSINQVWSGQHNYYSY